MLLAAHPHDFLVAPNGSRLTVRKARHVGTCALARRHWHILPESSSVAVVTAEQYGDDEARMLEAAWIEADATMDTCDTIRSRRCAETA